MQFDQIFSILFIFCTFFLILQKLIGMWTIFVCTYVSTFLGFLELLRMHVFDILKISKNCHFSNHPIPPTSAYVIYEWFLSTYMIMRFVILDFQNFSIKRILLVCLIINCPQFPLIKKLNFPLVITIKLFLVLTARYIITNFLRINLNYKKLEF